MTIEIRRTRPEEYRAASNTISAALLFPPVKDDDWERALPSWEQSSSMTAWDGERCVGHAAEYFVDTVVPGGARVPTGAVTRVGVLPTHRRRGAASALLNALIAEAVDEHLTLMSLRASEAVIYSRYGFGVAGDFTEATIDPRRARPISGATEGGTIRLLAGDEIHTTIHDVYERGMHRRVGTVSRPDPWWQRYFRDAASGEHTSHVVVHEAVDGTIDGYAHYDVSWNEDMSGGKGEVHDVVAVDDGVELALWRYLLEIDLIRTWKADERPVDDIVRWAVADSRAYTIKSVDDEQWVRVVDVEAALSARTYNPAVGSVTVGVSDPIVDANNGAWTIDAGGAKPSELTPDLTVDIATLSAAYLGGTAWASLAAVGRVDVATPGAVALADTLFGVRPLPFCGSFF